MIKVSPPTTSPIDNELVPRPIQIEGAREGYEILKNYGVVYYAWEERVGKTLTSILVAEMSKAKNILVVSTKKAIEDPDDENKGWMGTLKNFTHTKHYSLINYESFHYVKQVPDLVIIDEAHKSLGRYPKPSKTQQKLKELLYDCPIIYMSATPSAQSYSQLYHQFDITKFSPWSDFSKFYVWHTVFGISDSKRIGSIKVKRYDRVHNSLILEDIKHIILSKTRKESGIHIEPKDHLHYIPLPEDTMKLYRKLERDSTFEINGNSHIADTPMGRLMGLHQLEGGTLKQQLPDVEGTRINLIGINRSKIDYILDNFGDLEENVIMYHYKNEKKYLEKHFKKSKILQSITYAEGTDLSGYKTLIIYSMNFSTSKYSQRRARQCNINREEDIDVHFLLCRGLISDQVYDSVATKKRDFVDSYYKDYDEEDYDD